MWLSNSRTIFDNKSTVTLQFNVNCKITLTRKTGYVEFQQVLNVTNSTLTAVRKVRLTVSTPGMLFLSSATVSDINNRSKLTHRLCY